MEQRAEFSYHLNDKADCVLASMSVVDMLDKLLDAEKRSTALEGEFVRVPDTLELPAPENTDTKKPA